MSLTPKHEFILSYNKGDYITMYDTIGAYSISNPGGWGSPNSGIDNVTSAIVSVEDTDGNVVLTQDVTSVYPSTVGDPIIVATIDWAKDDGYYKFTTTIITETLDPGTYVSTYETVFFANALNACADLWVNAYPGQDCRCPDKRVLEAAIEAENLINGIKYAAGAYNIANVDKIVASSKKIIQLAEMYCV